MTRPKKDKEELLENLSTRVPAGLAEELKKVAVKADRPVSWIARKLIVRGLAAYERDGLFDEPFESNAMTASSHPELVGKEVVFDDELN